MTTRRGMKIKVMVTGEANAVGLSSIEGSLFSSSLDACGALVYGPLHTAHTQRDKTVLS